MKKLIILSVLLAGITTQAFADSGTFTVQSGNTCYSIGTYIMRADCGGRVPTIRGGINVGRALLCSYSNNQWHENLPLHVGDVGFWNC